MKNSKIVLTGLLHSLGVLAYVVLVVWVMNNGERFFGKMAGQFWGPVAMLLLFVLSATIVGLLVLGRPGYLYFNGQKTEAWCMLFYTLGWLAVFTVIVFLSLAFYF
jgi:hypothetical protein